MKKNFTKKLLIALFFLGTTMIVNAQEQLNLPSTSKIKSEEEVTKFMKGLIIGVNVQAQWQLAQSKGMSAPQIGGSFGEFSDNRFMLRRGYIKVGYKSKYYSALVQINATASGVSIVNAYAEVNSASKSVAFRVGNLYKPFGYFIYFSSSARMFPEVTRGEQSLFSNQTGLGARLQLRDTRDCWTRYFSLNAAYFSGNGQKKDQLTPKDFIAKLEYTYPFSDNIVAGVQSSILYGTLTNQNDDIYYFNSKSNTYDVKEDVRGETASRHYYSFGGTFQLKSTIGKTKLFGEYIFGRQLGSENGNISPSASAAFTAPLYKRNFSTYYIYLQHTIANTNATVMFKYDSYDPNTKIKASNITSAADVRFDTFALGANYKFWKHMSISAYYEFVNNERCYNLEGYNKNRKDNLLTIRMQCAF